MLASMYYAMLFTNWGNPDLYRNGDQTDESMRAFWLKIVCEWFTMAVYVFSLLAPLIFTNRTFE